MILQLCTNLLCPKTSGSPVNYLITNLYIGVATGTSSHKSSRRRKRMVYMLINKFDTVKNKEISIFIIGYYTYENIQYKI